MSFGFNAAFIDGLSRRLIRAVRDKDRHTGDNHPLPSSSATTEYGITLLHHGHDALTHILTAD